jgi:uncharacterized repeat protein (TIGR04076 family)
MVRYKVIATVKSVKGKCPNQNQVGDRIEVERGKVVGCKCPSAFNSIYPIVFAMRFGAKLPWLEDEDVAIAACPDPEHQVIFEIRRVKIEE